MERCPYGKFDDYADGKKRKLQAWNKVQSIIVAHSVDKSVTQLRDMLWKNLRLGAIKKNDERRKTGSNGGLEAERKITKLDDLVLQIIRRESASVVGLSVEDSNVLNGEAQSKSSSCLGKGMEMAVLRSTQVESETGGPSDAHSRCKSGRPSMIELLAEAHSPIRDPEPDTPRKQLKRKIYDEKEEFLLKNLRLRNEKLKLEIRELKTRSVHDGI
ncbi:hypothetical protein BOX15_Mlig014637g1 [Macrostomum lignano]|uniref:Regulatory protein zeste n=1 Tax=Macrostomum lignano TaxID=282301 RepID=A0A267DJI0_9PLAT|nr:hypothetical protein BOX15_Mlig014637g1 [Macrostomum lignano]